MNNEEALQKIRSKDWRIPSLYSISSKAGGQTVRFKPNRAQQLYYDARKTHKKIIILKSRQLGITSGVVIDFLDEVLFNENINALSVMDKQENAISAFDGKVRFAWENLDVDLKAYSRWSVDTERANQLTFGFGAGSYSSYSVRASGRSGTFHRVHISEFGKLCATSPIHAKEVITGTFPAVPQDGVIVVESTAEGETGYFFDMWNDAVAGVSQFHPIFINWRYDDTEIALAPETPLELLPEEFQQMAKDNDFTLKEANYIFGKFLLLGRDWQLLKQEYPLTAAEAFQGSGEKLFDMLAIEQMEKHTMDGRRAGKTTIYFPYKEGRRYVVGADPAEGVGKDASAAVVWEIDGVRAQIVATYASDQADPENFAYVLRELSTVYGGAVIAVERNNHGHAVIAILRRIMDESLLFRESTPTNVVIREEAKFGFKTTAVSKPEILSSIAAAVRNFEIYVPSKEVLIEMRLCPKKEMLRILPKEGVTRHFDLLMAAAIGYHAIPFTQAHLGRANQPTTTLHTTNNDPYAAI